MKSHPRIGMAAEERIVVGPANRIVFADELMPAVLATPWLVAHLEYAARRAIEPCLEDFERSVGTFLEIEHLAPTPEGFAVVCKARVIGASGPVITFQLEAHDGSRNDRPWPAPAPGHRRSPVRPPRARKKEAGGR